MITYSTATLNRLRADALDLSTVVPEALRDGDPVRDVGLVVWVENRWNSRDEPWAALNVAVAGRTHALIFPSVMASLAGDRLLPGIRLTFLARASVAGTGVTLHLVEARIRAPLT